MNPPILCRLHWHHLMLDEEISVLCIIWILFIIFGRGCKCISAMVLRTLFMECWPPRDNWWDNEDGQLDDNEGYSVEEETEYENSV
ncbi:hypothetical protein LINPERPRIM_LOCUS37100 [Linum perenne]